MKGEEIRRKKFKIQGNRNWRNLNIRLPDIVGPQY